MGDPPFTKDNLVYSADKDYPGKLAVAEPVKTIRGQNCTIIWLNPFQYNPVKKELKVYKDLSITINFKGEIEPVPRRPKNKSFETLLRRAALNADIVMKAQDAVSKDESLEKEETDGNGTLACCDRGYSADAAIVVDSVDDITRIIVAQAGVAYFRLKITGRSAHLCQKYTPEEGVSAIDRMRVILDGLDIFQKERESLKDADYSPKKPIIGVTMISGGGIDRRSTFPEECLAEV